MTDEKTTDNNPAGVSRRHVLKTAGAAGVAMTGLVAVSGSAAAWEDCESVCYKLDRAPRKGETLLAGDVPIKITKVYTKDDNEVYCFRFVVQNCNRVQKVIVKGGPTTNEYEYPSTHGFKSRTVCAPLNEKSPHEGDRYGVSHVIFCVWEDCEYADCDEDGFEDHGYKLEKVKEKDEKDEKKDKRTD